MLGRGTENISEYEAGRYTCNTAAQVGEDVGLAHLWIEFASHSAMGGSTNSEIITTMIWHHGDDLVFRPKRRDQLSRISTTPIRNRIPKAQSPADRARLKVPTSVPP